MVHFYKIGISETQYYSNAIVSKEIMLLNIVNHRNIIGFF